MAYFHFKRPGDVMSCNRVVLAILPFAMALAPSQLAAANPSPIVQATSDSISGKVTDPVGTPVAGARVSLTELGRSVLTDPAGHFSFGSVPRGRYTLLVTRARFGAVSRVITTTDASATTIALSPEEQRLPTVTVTSTRSPSAVAGTPLPFAELRDEQLRKEQSVSLARAIELVPGVRNISTGEQIGKPMIRGLTGSRVLVLDNGLRVEDYSWSDEDGPSVEARLADRIEVIRGPASLLYGSDAIGGVVNAVPADLPYASGGRSFRRLASEAFFGSNNTEIGGGLRAEGASGAWGWRLFGIGRFAEDLKTPDGKLDNTGFFAANGDAAIAHHGRRGTSTLRYTRYGGEYKLLEASKPAGSPEEGGGPERVLGDDRLQFVGNYALRGSRLETRLQLQRHNLIEKSDDLVPLGGPKDAEVFNLLLNSLTGDVLLHRAVGSHWQTTTGVSGLLQASDSRGITPIIPDATTTSGGVFTVGQFTQGRATILAGVRADGRHVDAKANSDLSRVAQTRSSAAVSGDAGLVYRLTNSLSLTGNAGRAWRAPTLFELYANGPRLGEARFEIGDPNLDPESSLNLDGGLRWSVSRARFEASAFHNDIDKFIFITPTGATASDLPVYRYEQARSALAGAEFAAEVRPTDELTLRARHDFVRGTRKDDQSPLPLIPAARTDVEAETHWDRLGGLSAPSLGVEVEFNARQNRRSAFDIATRAYTIVNLEAGSDFHWFARDVHAGLRVRNLMDSPYRSYLSRYKDFALDAGRNVMLRLSTGF